MPCLLQDDIKTRPDWSQQDNIFRKENINQQVTHIIPSKKKSNSYHNAIKLNFFADRLLVFVPAITSTQQRGFIKGRSIKDCICLTSEAINVLNKKFYGGNVAMKIDIAKA